MNSLLSALESCEAHFATITETKLESDPPFLEGYTWLKKNRNIKQGGGVAIAIRNDILSQVRIIDKVEPDDDTKYYGWQLETGIGKNQSTLKTLP
jgi:hypothetical protein